MTQLAGAEELTSWLDGDPGLAVAAAEALVRNYCGWHIAPLSVDDQVIVDGSGERAQPLPTLHLTGVSRVVEDGVDVAVVDGIWSEAGFLWRDQPWTNRLRGVEVTMTHGYEEVPAEVKAIVLAVAQRGMDNPRSLVRTQDGPFSDTYSQTGFNQSLPIALLEAEKAILDRYRIPERP